MNSYELSRHWFDYSFSNPEKIRPIHASIYFFAIDHCNRLGWKEKFGFPSQMVMEAIGVKNWRTYSKALNDLVDFGFIKMIEISKNQYSGNIIAIVENTKASTKALDKALQKHSTKHSQSTVSIDKQYNNITINNITSEILNSESWITQIAMKKRIDVSRIKIYLGTFLDDLELKGELNDIADAKRYFINWLNIELKKETPKKDLSMMAEWNGEMREVLFYKDNGNPVFKPKMNPTMAELKSMKE